MKKPGHEQSRRRVLFVAEAVTLAHVVRPFVLARSLDPEQFEVHFASDPRYNHLLGSLPFPVHRIHSMSSERFFAALTKTDPIFDLELLRGYVEEELTLLRNLKPDAVVGDFRFSLAVSARLCQIPYFGLINAYWSPYANPRFVIPDVSLTKWLGPTVAQALYSIGRPFFFAQHAKPFNQLRAAYGLPKIPADLRHVFTDADVTLYPDIPELIPTQNLPGNHHYIGSIPWSPAVPHPQWWDRIPPDRLSVYVTLGSSGNGELLPLVARALADLPVNVLIATAGKISSDRFPSGTFVADFLPGDEACARSKLVICNGGSPTTHQALAAGVPVLGLASNSDQFLNMDGIVNAGAGKVLRAENASTKKIRQATMAVLAHTNYASAATTIGQAFEKTSAGNALRDLLTTTLPCRN